MMNCKTCGHGEGTHYYKGWRHVCFVKHCYCRKMCFAEHCCCKYRLVV